MLAKKFKFSREDFKNIQTKTVFKQNTVFGLLYIMPENYNKNVIVIPKKVYKKASERNNLKRIFYNTLRNTIKPKLENGVAIFIKQKIDPLLLPAELVRIIDNYKNSQK